MTAISLLLLVGLFSAAGAIMAYYFLKNPDLLFGGKNRTAPTATITHLKFEDAEFLIPEYLLGTIQRSALRKVKNINLLIPLNWAPEQEPVAFNASSDLSKWIIAHIEKRSSVLPEKVWLGRIYRTYIAAPASAHSSGLFRYRFKPGSPYDSVELFTDNLQNPGLIIRCEMQNSTLGIRLCSRVLPVTSRIIIHYKFPRSQINNWQQIHMTMQKLLKTIFKPNGV